MIYGWLKKKLSNGETNSHCSHHKKCLERSLKKMQTDIILGCKRWKKKNTVAVMPNQDVIPFKLHWHNN